MNFDRILLSNYSPAEADWGIEETVPLPRRHRFNSATTSELSQPPPFNYDFHRSDFRDNAHSLRSPSISQGPFGFSDHSLTNVPLQKPSILPNTENFHKYIRKYLSLEKNTQIVEKFKYNLVLSNLLDDTLVLSKNEQALNNLVQIRNSEDRPLHAALTKQFNFDGSVLRIVDKLYRLEYPRVFQRSGPLIRTLCLIIFLLKQNLKLSSNLSYSSRVQLFKVLLVVSTRIVKFARATSIIEASKSVKSLDDFMIANCRVNKVLITSILTLKEHEMFSFLNKPASTAPTENTLKSPYSAQLGSHLMTLLDCLIINVKHSICELLPLSNSEMLEKYCQINNVPLGQLLDYPETATDSPLLEMLTLKMNYFNNYRRFFICQLLTIHENSSVNFFLLKLCDSFNIELDEPKFVTLSAKLNKLEKVFGDHTATLEQIRSLNERFRSLNKSNKSADFANDNVLSSADPIGVHDRHADELFAPDADLNLNNLINKLQNLTASLKYFKKYSQSIANINDAEEYDEKISIFSLFSTELKSSSELFNICVNDYQNDFNLRFVEPTSNASSRTNSQHNSYNSDQFSLKSFHTSSTKAKRDSKNSVIKEKSLNSSRTSTERRSKRQSTGLQLGLLTVVEEPGSRGADQKTGTFRKSSSDDNNADVGSPTNFDTFNQAALDALTKKLRNSRNRFSINSVNSNVSGLSDLIASTQITTDEDEGDNPKTRNTNEGGTRGMSKDELRLKLEESFSRIYSLENENIELKLMTFSNEIAGESHTEDTMDGEVTLGAAKDAAFLGELEKSLILKTMT